MISEKTQRWPICGCSNTHVLSQTFRYYFDELLLQRCSKLCSEKHFLCARKIEIYSLFPRVIYKGNSELKLWGMIIKSCRSQETYYFSPEEVYLVASWFEHCKGETSTNSLYSINTKLQNGETNAVYWGLYQLKLCHFS